MTTKAKVSLLLCCLLLKADFVHLGRCAAKVFSLNTFRVARLLRLAHWTGRMVQGGRSKNVCSENINIFLFVIVFQRNRLSQNKKSFKNCNPLPFEEVFRKGRWVQFGRTHVSTLVEKISACTSLQILAKSTVKVTVAYLQFVQISMLWCGVLQRDCTIKQRYRYVLPFSLSALHQIVKTKLKADEY